MGFMSAMRSAITAFRKEWLASDLGRYGFDPFGTLDARRLRYALFWAFYEGSAYDSTPSSPHGWGNQFKATAGLYKGTRGEVNFAHRLGEFWATGIMGGPLDPAAGDGSRTPSALPIVTADDDARAAISRLWSDSNWQTAKSIWSRRGAMLGDAPLKVVDDPVAGSVQLHSIHPRTLRDVEQDRVGNVQSYVIEEVRPDPLVSLQPFYSRGNAPMTCVYHEVCERTERGVVFRTYRNQQPFDWTGAGTAWEEPWPFVPLVLVKHLDFGHPTCGMSEFHGALTKAMSSDDYASKLSDSVRKAIEPIWFFTGMKGGDLDLAKPSRPGDPADYDRRQADRQEVRSISSTSPDAKAQALVSQVDIVGASGHLRGLLDDQLQDYPELRFDRIRASGDASGNALREARKPAEAKVQERRSGYDDALNRAMRMAVAIGGWRGYDAYRGFGLESFGSDPVFSIGPRTVFDLDPLDRIAEDTARAGSVAAWVGAGIPLAVALRRAGWPEAEIEAATASR